jgi:hypothetical protein
MRARPNPVLAFLFMGLLACSSALAVHWPAISLEPMATGFDRVTHITHAGDGSGRTFVVQQTGVVSIVQGGSVLPVPFLNISDRVSTNGGERGFFALAFPTNFSAHGRFYASYTRHSDGASIVSRFTVDTNTPNVAPPGSEEILLTVPQPFANHNGGQIAFSPLDGFLYIGMGDGGSGNDPGDRAQNQTNLLGKILRIGVEPPNGTNYFIPASNPFFGQPGWREEIWALGLRNPWRFAFDSLNGDLYIADVGQSAWEEVNYQPGDGTGGENYGWRIMEGNQCTGLDPCVTNDLTLPVHVYDHGQGCSITGGEVSRQIPWSFMYGVYFFSDYCNGRIWGLRRDENTNWVSSLLLDAPFSITTFGQDEDGTLYVNDYWGGRILRIVETLADTDEDGMPDAWELYNGFSTNNPADAVDDEDEDGASNLDEFLAGTDPLDPTDVFQVFRPDEEQNDGIFSIRWSSVHGKQYQVYRTTNMLDTFTPRSSVITATPPINIFLDDVDDIEGAFYLIAIP